MHYPRNISQSFFLLLFLLSSTVLMLSACRPDNSNYTPEQVQALNQYLDSRPPLPSKLLTAEIAKGASAVFVPDNVLRADSIRMIQAVLPAFYQAGIRNMGVFFLSGIDQNRIDSLILEPASPESSARDSADQLLLSSGAAMGYREYTNFLLYVKQFNQSLANQEEALRIWPADTLLQQMKESSESSEPAETAETAEPAEKKEPVFLWLRDSSQLDTEMEELVSFSHFGPGKNGLRWGGLMEKTLEERDIRDRSFSFKPSEPPFSEWQDEQNEPLKTNIFIVTPYQRRAVTPLPDLEDKTRSAAKYQRYLKHTERN